MKRAMLVFLLCLAARGALGAKVADIKVAVQGDQIDVYLYEPEGAGPFPLLVLSHGSPRNPEDRPKMGPEQMSRQVAAYLANGVAVAVPIRRGYGANRNFVEGFNPQRPDYYVAGLTSADDIGSAIAALKQRREIDGTRVVLMGVSAGGWASIAAGTRDGVMGVVNFAGGRGSNAPDHVTGEPQLLRAAALYGEQSKTPELWIYSENDHFFGPDLAHAMYDAFTAAGGKAKFIAAPAYQNDGHGFFYAVAMWKPEVDEFLREIGFLKGA